LVVEYADLVEMSMILVSLGIFFLGKVLDMMEKVGS
jgi:hypothetical protein